MKQTVVSLLLISCFAVAGYSQNSALPNRNDYYQLIQGSKNSGKYQTLITSDIDSNWKKWEHRGYGFGFDKTKTPMYTTVNGILSTPYMVQVRGNLNEYGKKRWGFHVFEGYAKDDQSRITMLVNKHNELGKPVAEMYYYGTVYDHSESAYNWFRIGSDVRQHSFLFSRDKAIFYGSLNLANTLTLGQIGRDNLRKNKPEGDPETNYSESAKYVNYKSLKNSGDGTVFYDKDNKMVVIKINGEWMKLAVEKLPEGVNYDF